MMRLFAMALHGFGALIGLDVEGYTIKVSRTQTSLLIALKLCAVGVV